jgi:hypothetical protein
MKTNKQILTTCKTIIIVVAFLTFFMQKSFGQSVNNDLSQHAKISGTNVKYQVHTQAGSQQQTTTSQKRSMVKALPAEKKPVVAPSKTMTQNSKALQNEATLKNKETLAIPESTNKTKVD